MPCMETPGQTARDVVSILDQWCSKKDTLVRTQFQKHKRFLDNACYTRDVDRMVNEMRLISKEHKSLIDKKLAEIDESSKEWNNIVTKEVGATMNAAIGFVKESVSLLTNARKITFSQRFTMETDIKNLDFKHGEFDEFIKVRKIDRKRVEDMEKITCPDRTKAQLVLTCKQEFKPRCTTYNKEELISLMC